VNEIEMMDISAVGWDTTGGNLMGPAGVSGTIGPEGPAGADGSDAPTTFSGLSDTPNTYEDGKYLRVTSSGIEAIDGIILKSQNDSEFLLTVTNSGILGTTAL
jgi:hypothetical protein